MAAAVTETWWREEYSDAQLSIEGFHLIRSDRKKRRGGGCALYVNSAIPIHDQFTYTDESNSAALAYVKESHTVIGVVYRAPNSPVTELLDSLSRFLDSCEGSDVTPDIYLTGDFNMPSIDWATLGGTPDPAARQLLSFVEAHFLTQLVDSPTRGSNTLDLVFSNRPDYVVDTQVSDSYISDHLLVTCTLGFGLNPKPSPSPKLEDFFAFSFHEADFAGMRDELDEIDWDALAGICSDEDGSDFVQLVNLTVLQVLSHHSRRKKAHHKRRDPVLRRLKIKQRDLNKRLARAREHQTPAISQLEVSVARVTLQIMSHISERLQEDELGALGKIKSNPKFFWTYANKKRKMRSRIPPLLKDDGSLTDVASEKAELFQTQFTSVFSTPSPDPSNAANSITPSTTYISDIEFTPAAIERALADLNAYSAGPPGDIPARILRECRSSLSYPLFIIWSKSFDSGIVPTFLKYQHISPLYKKGSKSVAGNYRPISLTSHIAKTFERVVRSQLVDYFESADLFNDSQHGFRRGRSCLTQLTRHLDYVLNSLNSLLEVDVIYLDFEKAFDKVDIGVLIEKLKKYGVKGKLLAWIESFLRGRKQTVMVDGTCSSFADVLSGVPQGTVLGPILFLIYVIDLESVLQHGTSLSFADDTKISAAIRSMVDKINLQEDLNNVISWADLNNMSLHQAKFEVINYKLNHTSSLRELPLSAENYLYQLSDGRSIDPSHTVRDLGVLLSSDGSWSAQIARVVSEARRVAGWTLGAFKSRSPRVMMTLYKSLVRPHLDYCCTLWSPTKIGDISRVEDIQRAFTRKIGGLRGLNYWQRLQTLGLLSLQRRRERYTMILVWKVYNGEMPNTTNMSFIDSHRSGPRAVVPKYSYEAQRANLTLFEGSFAVKGAQLWNTLPQHVKESPTLFQFKTSLGKFLSTIPDTPPVSGYPPQNGNNSILQCC